MVCDEDRIDYLVNFYSESNHKSIIDLDFYCHCDRHRYRSLVEDVCVCLLRY